MPALISNSTPFVQMALLKSNTSLRSQTINTKMSGILDEVTCQKSGRGGGGGGGGGGGAGGGGGGDGEERGRGGELRGKPRRESDGKSG